MDHYFPVISKSSHLKASQDKTAKGPRQRYHPYKHEEPKNHAKSPADSHNDPEEMPSPTALTKYVLKTLKDPSNPITHSDIYERSDHIVSCTTGHQVADGGHRGRRLYFGEREQKLAQQREPGLSGQSTNLLRQVRVYIDGYLENTTDIEIKRIVCEAGGQIVMTASSCTHILSSRQLSGSKTHKLLTMRTRNKVHVVRPEWVFDSVKVGRRQPERKYAIIKDTSANSDTFIKFGM